MVVDGITVVTLNVDDLVKIKKEAAHHKLDFEDAYQHLAARKYNLQIISFDRHFDRTKTRRKEPDDILQ